MRLRSKPVIILSFVVFILAIILLFTVVPNIIISITGLLAVSFVMFYWFGKLGQEILTRDEQLEKVNKALESEIAERKSVEEELSIHRDYLEGLITDGTRELEIKNQEIEASEKKFRAITSAIHDAIIMIDSRGMASFWNQSAQRIFGYSVKDLQGKKLYRLIVPNPTDKKSVEAFRIFEDTNEEKTVEETIEVEARRANGTVFPIEISMSVVNIQGSLNTLAVIRDVTKKKEGERYIKILSSAVEQSSVGVMITDTGGTIQYINPKFTEVTGYGKVETLGQTPNILNSNMHPPEFFKNLWETISSGSEWYGELQNKKKDGELYWDASLISPIKDSRGSITHYVAIKEDISERKRMEVELISARKSAEAASRSKSEFLANMSHEIRTPMNAIIGMTELVLDTKITKEQREYLNIVQQSSSSLLSLLNDILDLSKIEAGKLALEPISFNLYESMGETVKTLGVQAHKKELELVYYIDSEVPSQLLGDMGRLRQIIVNLIGNSIKFTKEGEIVVKVELMEEQPDNRVLLHFLISDTGIGIAEEKLKTIFEKFSQADTSTTRKYGGSGLGLTISSKLVELMDGIIWAESPSTFPHFIQSGNGSTFHFTASFQVDQDVVESRKTSDIDKLAGLSVLVVDDNKTNRRFLVEVLSKYGLEPEEADCGQNALQQLKEKEFQMLILDFQMPVMDGPIILQKVREELNLNIPVILLSSGIKQDELDHLKQYNVDAYFYKPINTRELMESIAVAMGYEKITDTKSLPDTETDEVVEPGQGVHILVVEDNNINQQLIKRLLEKKGHMVDIAGDGQQALEKFNHQTELPQEDQYQLIFMDIQMPVMDGVTATNEIRKQNSSIPIIALTAHAMKGDKTKFMAEGMNDYISKPIQKDYLFKLLEKYIQRNI